MSFYKLLCNNCNHIFYDIRVTCSDKSDFVCPMCGKSKISETLIPPKDNQLSAEDKGCRCKNKESGCNGRGGCHSCNNI